MEIEVNEYVRTDRGIIAKVDEIRLGTNRERKVFQNIYELDNGLWTVIDYIKKHSKNIIDLIEVGDLIKTNEEKTIIHIYDNDTLEAVKEDIEEGHFKIEAIITHEMFESIEYKVEESK